MRRCPFRRRANAWLALVLGLATPALADPVAARSSMGEALMRAGTGETLVLAVTLDGVSVEEPLVAHQLGRALRVQASDLRRIGVALPRDTASEVDLASLAALHFVINDAKQTLELESVRAGPARLSLKPAAGLAEQDLPPALGWGGFVNYDVTAYRDPAGSRAGGTLDAVAFTPTGYSFAGAIVRKPATGAAIVRRTDIGYTSDRRDRLASVTVGDFVNAASNFSRPVRMAGLRVGTDFSLRPDLVTFPVPTITGTAAVPTAVDVLVNGDRQAAGDVRAGRFSISDVPVQTGINTIAVATRDALGRSVLQTVTTYASRELLRPGLLAFSAEAGWLRTGYLTPDDRYRALATSFTVRRGMTDRLTLEAHAEATRSMVDLGAGGSVSLARLGLLDAAVAVNRDSITGRGGAQLSFGMERIARPVSLSARYTRNTPGWSDLADRYGSVTRDHSLILSIGFDLKRFGTLSTNIVDLGQGRTRFGQGGGYLRGASTVTRAATLLNASYTARLVRQVGLVATFGVDARQRRSVFASVGALILFGSRTSGYAGAQHQSGEGGAGVSLTRTPIEQGQWGYRLAAATGRIDQASAAVQYLAAAGEVQAAIETIDGRVDGQVSAHGSVGLAGGRPFASNTMTSSFAVIETRGQANLAIYQDNRRIGATNARGILVAPNLPAYEKIKFSIDPVEADAAAQIERADIIVSLPRRSGAAIAFDLRPTGARPIRLVDPDGRPLPPGTRATIGGKSYPVGIGGALYARPPADGSGDRIRLDNGADCWMRMPETVSLFKAVTAVCTSPSTVVMTGTR